MLVRLHHPDPLEHHVVRKLDTSQNFQYGELHCMAINDELALSRPRLICEGLREMPALPPHIEHVSPSKLFGDEVPKSGMTWFTVARPEFSDESILGVSDRAILTDKGERRRLRCTSPGERRDPRFPRRISHPIGLPEGPYTGCSSLCARSNQRIYACQAGTLR